jgi:Recombination endonuclease VII
MAGKIVTCRGCGKEFEGHSVDKIGRIYKARRFYCTVDCRNLHYLSSNKHTNNHRRGNYKLSELQFEKMVASQNGLCLVCELPLNDDIHVDHDHLCCPTIKTCGKCIRGLIHGQCNIGLGAFGDSPEKLRKAARYLEVSKAMQPFKVKLEEAVNFSKVWSYNGVSIPITKEEAQYATDFANVVLRNFIDMCQEQAKAAQKAAEPKKLIIEGL